MTIQENLQLLQAKLKEHHIDAYIIPSADYHQSEYVGEHFKARAFITGFLGSAGTALITPTAAHLWTDGRYFVQAEKELRGSGITLMKMGNAGVPTMNEFLADSLAQGSVLGFDGRVISVTEGLAYEKLMNKKSGSIIYNLDLIQEIWFHRPALAAEPMFHLTEAYTGASTSNKLARIREKMAEVNATTHIITSLDDLCWTFNFRGSDVMFSPLTLGYASIHMDSVDLFITEDKLNDEIRADLAENAVTYHSYNDIYEYVKNIDTTSRLLVDPAKLNYTLYKNIPDTCTKIEMANPSILMKSLKNEVELENIRIAHIKDGIAVTKYIHWVKTNVGKLPMDELICSDKLEAFRAEQDGFMWPSFDPICAYLENAALCHYRSTPETNKTLQPEGLFLNDTGGNYREGSTDITRTFALGPISDEIKMHFTTVAKSMLALMNTKFMSGISGANLDIIARQAFWSMDMNYNHGTGHGVGYLLSIHEGPGRITWQTTNPETLMPLQEGMIFSDEPGYYVDGSHGIRTENELVVRKGVANEYGQFMYFENLTFAPIDLDAMDVTLLNEQDKKYLNDYHQQVWEKISPYLDADEKAWLKKYTRAI